MDEQIKFIKEVIEPYKITKILTPKNLGNGELENVLLSDLRENLDFCFNTVSYIPFKKLLVDYVENYLIELREKIDTKKHKVKRLKKTERKLNKKVNKLDENNNKNDIFFEELSNYSWKLNQEKYILDYLHEQKHFIRNWVVQKRNTLDDYSKDAKQLNLRLKKILKKYANKEQISEKQKDNKGTKNFQKPLPKYCEIGSLFAQGFIRKEKIDFGNSYYYKDKSFEDISKLSRYLQNAILKTDTSIRQYVNDTLSSEGIKNLYKSKKMMNNIIEYCKINNIEIAEFFQLKYNDLVNMH